MQTGQTAFGTALDPQPATAGAISANPTDDSPSKLFTTLLVAQIRYQNPLEPVDPGEFVGQLTQLSQMEALQNLARQTGANGTMLESLQTLTLGSLVGTDVTVETLAVNIADNAVRGSFNLESGAEAVAVVLTAGGTSHRVELGPRAPGEVAFTVAPQQMGIPAGTYSVRVDAGEGVAPPVGIVGELRNVRVSPSGHVTVAIEHIGEVPAGSISVFNGNQHS